jgi:hypothetical protein
VQLPTSARSVGPSATLFRSDIKRAGPHREPPTVTGETTRGVG